VEEANQDLLEMLQVKSPVAGDVKRPRRGCSKVSSVRTPFKAPAWTEKRAKCQKGKANLDRFQFDCKDCGRSISVLYLDQPKYRLRAQRSARTRCIGGKCSKCFKKVVWAP